MTFIDLFAGIGGFRIAMESVGAKCVFSSEWDKHAQQTYEANFGEKPHGDITKIDAKDIPPHNVLCAGFPCQPFSIAGDLKGFEDIRGTLFFEIIKIVKYHKTKVLFLENVRNLISHDKGKTFQIILNSLKELGYYVHYKVLNSKNFGVPQNRQRVFIVAFLDDVDFKFPEPNNQVTCVADILEDNVEDKYFLSEKAWTYHKERKIKNKAKGLGFGYTMVNGDSVYTPTLTAHYCKDGSEILINKEKPLQIGKINKGGQGERLYSIDATGITLSACGGGIASKTGAYLIQDKIRKLTPRECARLQGYHDSFIIPVRDSQAYKQFGNSVTVNVVKAIAEQIIRHTINNHAPSF